MNHGDIRPIIVLVLNGIVALTTVFIACELSQRLNDAFDEIDITFGQSDWYLFPIEIRRMLPMSYAVAQQPVSLECFGSATCTREVFESVSIWQSIIEWTVE